MTSRPIGGATGDDPGDRELLAVLVALAPLDSRKWDYLDLQRRAFHADAMLEQSWSSGERALIEVAQSLWNEGKVDLGYLACALGPKHLQAVLDATAIRAGQPLASDTRSAIHRVSAMTLRRGSRPTREEPARHEPELAVEMSPPTQGLEL